MEINFIDTFMYNDETEIELLIAKLNTEDCERLLKWVIIENAYTFQGRHKGWKLKEILDRDHRFQRFKTRIKIIEVVIKNENHWSEGNREGSTMISTKKAFNVEHRQRMAGIDYILNISDPWTCVIVSDIDEMVDLSNKYKLSYLLLFLERNNCMASVNRKKYIYDIDNIWPEEERRYINIVSVAHLGLDKANLAKARSYLLPICDYYGAPIGFEYSFVMNYESLLIKLNAYSHVLSDPERSLKQALILNTKPYEILPDRYMMFEKGVIRSIDSSIYIMDNQDKFRTDLVSRYYKDIRVLLSRKASDND